METHEILFQLRVLAKLGVSEMADILGCDRTLVPRYEKDKRTPSFPFVQKWINATKPDVSSPDYEKWLFLVSFLIFGGNVSDYEILVTMDALSDQDKGKKSASDNALTQIMPKHFLVWVSSFFRKKEVK